MTTQAAVPWREEPWVFGAQGALVGIATTPIQPRAGTPTVLILNSGFAHRIGPFRASVALARFLAAAGYHVLRFDTNGLGDSEARSEGSAADRALADVADAIAAARAGFAAERFVVVGLCSGALAAHYALRLREVMGAVMIDGYGYKTPRYLLHDASARLLSAERWKARLAQLPNLNALATRLRGRTQVQGYRAAGAAATQVDLPIVLEAFPPQGRVNAELFAAAQKGARTLFVFTGASAYYLNYDAQMADALPAIRNRHAHCVRRWHEVDHTFSLRADRQRLFDEIVRWLGSPS